MKKVLLFILFLIILLSMTACGSSIPGEDTEDYRTATEVAWDEALENEEEPEQEVIAEEPEQEKIVIEEDRSYCDLGDYEVKIKDVILYQSHRYDGDCVLITIDFTNNSDETLSTSHNIYTKAFQDGIELDSNIDSGAIPEEYDFNAYRKDIRPGATIEFIETFELISNSEIEIEVTELLGHNNKMAYKVFQIAE